MGPWHGPAGFFLRSFLLGIVSTCLHIPNLVLFRLCLYFPNPPTERWASWTTTCKSNYPISQESGGSAPKGVCEGPSKHLLLVTPVISTTNWHNDSQAGFLFKTLSLHKITGIVVGSSFKTAIAYSTRSFLGLRYTTNRSNFFCCQR